MLLVIFSTLLANSALIQSRAQKTLDSPYRYSDYYQRQNDKFLYSNSEGHFYHNRQEDGRSAFQLTEETAPNGVTHGGYGYVDPEGQLIYVEYEKDFDGHVSKTDTKVVPEYEKSSFNEVHVEEAPHQHQEKQRPGRGIEAREVPIIEYGFLPIQGEPNLFYKEYFVRTPSGKAKPLNEPPPPHDDFLNSYGPPYDDEDVINNHVAAVYDYSSPPINHPPPPSNYDAPKPSFEYQPHHESADEYSYEDYDVPEYSYSGYEAPKIPSNGHATGDAYGAPPPPKSSYEAPLQQYGVNYEPPESNYLSPVEDYSPPPPPLPSTSKAPKSHHTPLKGHIVEEHGKFELQKITPTPGTAGYQQFVIHGVDTFYEIPNGDGSSKKQHHNGAAGNGNKNKGIEDDAIAEEIDQQAIWRENVEPPLHYNPSPAAINDIKHHGPDPPRENPPVNTNHYHALHNDGDKFAQPIDREVHTHQKSTAKPPRSGLATLTISPAIARENSELFGRFQVSNSVASDEFRQHHLHQRPTTTLPPLVISALPKVFQYSTTLRPKYTQRPFLSSTSPATFLVNPTTTVSTLRPVIRTTEPTKVTVTTVEPDEVHVTISSHGDDDRRLYPLPPMPTYAEEDIYHTPVAASSSPRGNRLPARIKAPSSDFATKPPFLRENLSQIPNPSSTFATSAPPTPSNLEVVNNIRELVENSLSGSDHFVHPQLVRELPRCTTCVSQLKSPISPPKSKPYTPSAPYPRTEAEVYDLPPRPNINHLPPRLTRPFRSTPGSSKGFESSVHKRQIDSSKPIPFDKPYAITLKVEDSFQGTRKLHDFGVYTQPQAEARAFDSQASGSSYYHDSDEQSLIAAAAQYAFERVK